MFHELALSLCWAFINIWNCTAPNEQTRLLFQLSNVISSRTFEDNSRKGRNTKTWRPCLRRPCPSLWGCAMSGLRWHLKQKTKKGFLKLFRETLKSDNNSGCKHSSRAHTCAAKLMRSWVWFPPDSAGHFSYLSIPQECVLDQVFEEV